MMVLVLIVHLGLVVIKGKNRIHQDNITFGISPIRIVLAGQFSGWYEYLGGAEKGLQT